MVEPELYDLKVHLSLGQAEIITNAALAAGKGEGMLPLTENLCRYQVACWSWIRMARLLAP